MNKTQEYELTVVVPVYNEVESLPRVERAMREWLPTSPIKACVLMVNDGSKDGSLELMREICARNEAMFYISLAKNGGLSAAMKAGIDATHSRYVGYIDADLQTTPEDFNLLLEHVAEYQLVMGIRAGRKDSFFKNLQSKIANGFRNMMTHDGAKDTGCPLKVMWTDYAKRVPFFTGMHRFLPALIQLQEGRMMQIPVRHFPRTEGVSKYHLWNRLIGPFKDCFAYRWMRKRYINYQIGEGNV
ncbi:MAG: glycosyltransferase family 2 protein [Rikenellaceae bacterium]|jgi:glycosyltransferase involved in cell wall biosynthesis|nr:glycosyltransferase family 2 protein [Rikenellaceae bacterium]MBQ2020724.1 glycosyltransferase family 2 protein [Rikenellaceae bacterium]MBQ5371773.1 glycosyltransferase family 2 protein [Rikenellaceae bacterium]MBQ5678974.1 glycosyltransferase family 2 protein [Rikenellaceae bacterium]